MKDKKINDLETKILLLELNIDMLQEMVRSLLKSIMPKQTNC